MFVTPDTMFEGVLQNYRYTVVRANNILFDFTIADFPSMNHNDIIKISKILGDLTNAQIQNKASYIIGYGHIKRA